jgi:hypothetical protein
MDKKDKKCAPDKQFSDGSCIPLRLLVEMGKAYNNEFADEIPIKISSLAETIYPSKYKSYLVKEFSERIEDCKSQRCWLKQKFMKRIREDADKKELNKYVFRYNGPDGKFEWLKTHNIDNVMDQYHKKYKDFKFLGTVPMDFADLPQLGFTTLNFKKLQSEGINKIGAVMNLDKHYDPGSHWVGMYSDLEKGEIYFFDSYGIRPPFEVRKFMRKIARYVKSTGKTPIVDFNRLQHQKKGSECGVYSINFILRMLEGTTFEIINTKRVSDDEVNKCRNTYFA